MNALIVNASARVARSLTREQAQLFVKSLKKIHFNCTFTTRDVGQDPPRHVSSEWIAAAFKPRADRTVAEDQALEEVAALMVNRDVEQLPVVREGGLVGFVTRDAVLRTLLGAGPAESDP